MEELAGRTAVVIGGGSGIGRGIALGLAAEQMRVVVADIDEVSAAAVSGQLSAAGESAIACQVDATDRASLAELAARAEDAFQSVHILVNTVGIILDRPLADADESDWAWFVEFNLMAMVRGVDVFLPLLRRHGEPAHIVNTSSMAGLLALSPDSVGGFHNGLYTTMKHALVGYSEMLRLELAPEGIGVSVLCPGLVAGNLAATSARNRPERFGGPLPAPQLPGMPPAAMPNEAVGPIVARGIKADRFYIFSHPEAVALVEQRHRNLVEDADFYASRR